MKGNSCITSAIRESGLYDSYPILSKDGNAKVDLLTNHVKTIVKEKNEAKLHARLLQKELDQLNLENQLLEHKTSLELCKLKEDFEANLQKAKIPEAKAVDAEKLLLEAQKEKLSLTLACTELQEDLRISKNRYEKEISDITEATNTKIKRMRDSFEAEKNDMRLRYDRLQQQKIDLQGEIGHLLRDKRATQSEYYSRAGKDYLST